MDLYFKTYSDAISAAIHDAEKQGYIVGVLSQRPKNGQTTRVSLPLYKKADTSFEKAVKPHLQIQVYNKGTSSPKPYELNSYIS